MITAIFMIVVSLGVGLAFAPKLPPWYAGLVVLPCMWSYVVQGVKRCHDLGKPWWWFLIPFYILCIFFEAGERGANEFGPAPKA